MNMPTNLGNDFSGLLQSPGKITPEDVLYFRREVFGDGIVSRQEAEAVFAINDSVGETCVEWTDFFLESLTDHIVHQVEPRGYVTTDNADWLIAMVTRDGRVDSATELELLLRVLSKSRSVPELLTGFVLKEIGRAVLEGEGPLARGHSLTPGKIGEPEVELVRHVMFAVGGDEGLSISRTEAEFLFVLNDQTTEAENHPAWRELYVKAISNYLMAAVTQRTPSRAEALAREEWLTDRTIDVGSVLRSSFSNFGNIFSREFLDGIFDDAHTQIEKAWAERNARQERAERAAERITDEEAIWLEEKMLQDGLICENERALLAHIREESPAISPILENRIGDAKATA